jgi:hypothetical protein
MNRLLAALLIAAATLAHGAPAPQTIIVNSQAATAPPLSVYRGSESAVRVKFYDGNVATALGSQVPFLSWSSNSLAATLTDAQIQYAASDVLSLHPIQAGREAMLRREGRMGLAEACFNFLPVRAELDLAGWAEEDIFSHS